MRARRAQTGRSLLARPWQWLRRRHPPLGIAFLLVVAAGAVFFAILPLLHRPQPHIAARHAGASRAARAPARPILPHQPPRLRHDAVIVPPSPPKAAVAKEEAPRPPAPLPAPPRGEPAWLRFAVPAPPAEKRPLVAIVLDDLGLDRTRTAEAIRLPGPLTLSFMTYAHDLPRQTTAARRAGHELLLHVPMEAADRREDPGPHALLTRLSSDEIRARLRWDLGRFDGFVGINNHMGSKFTADAEAMAPVIAMLRDRGLLFLDSRTTAMSSGLRLAAADGVPYAGRDVFLDDDLAPAAIAHQLALVEAVAHRRGSAIAIGHAHDATLAGLRAWLPTLPEKGLVLVPLSTVVRYRMEAAKEARR